MTFFLESPWPVLFIGIAVEAGLAMALLRTGQGKLLWWMLLVGVLTLAGFGIERLVVTDREAVTNTLDAAAAAVEDNDLERLLGCISPSAQRPRNDSRMVLDRFDVDKAIIHNLEIDFNRLTSPPTAHAHFQAIGTGRDRKGQIPYNTYTQRVVVNLRLEGDRWLVTGYSIEGVTPQRP
ncbi:MAG: hypothetical protein KKE86_16330 [Planctomycetes bacterium]|nr:hypothetical protein [Planctomycetota bacterium]MBU4400883.1 hypothetical protein [Planctomycetota bacterium]MCG2682410.1 hypothetical protein [Planctomycetales bacterium]